MTDTIHERHQVDEILRGNLKVLDHSIRGGTLTIKFCFGVKYYDTPCPYAKINLEPFNVEKVHDILKSLRWCFCSYCRSKLVEKVLMGPYQNDHRVSMQGTTYTVKSPMKKYLELYAQKVVEWSKGNALDK